MLHLQHNHICSHNTTTTRIRHNTSILDHNRSLRIEKSQDLHTHCKWNTDKDGTLVHHTLYIYWHPIAGTHHCMRNRRIPYRKGNRCTLDLPHSPHSSLSTYSLRRHYLHLEVRPRISCNIWGRPPFRRSLPPEIQISFSALLLSSLNQHRRH